MAKYSHLTLLFHKLLLLPQPNLIVHPPESRHTPWVHLYLVFHSALWVPVCSLSRSSELLELTIETTGILQWSLYLELAHGRKALNIENMNTNILAIRKWDHLSFGFRRKGYWHAWENLKSLRILRFIFPRNWSTQSLSSISFHEINLSFTRDINTHRVTSRYWPCGPRVFHVASVILRVIQPVFVWMIQANTDAALGSKMRLKAGEPTVYNKSALKSMGILWEVCRPWKQIHLQLLWINLGIYKVGV